MMLEKEYYIKKQYNIYKKYSFSFIELNKLKYFVKDTGTEDIVG